MAELPYRLAYYSSRSRSSAVDHMRPERRVVLSQVYMYIANGGIITRPQENGRRVAV